MAAAAAVFGTYQNRDPTFAGSNPMFSGSGDDEPRDIPAARVIEDQPLKRPIVSIGALIEPVGGGLRAAA